MPNIESIVGQIYEASIEPSSLRDVMATISHNLNGLAAWWCVARPSAESFYIVTDNVGCDPAMVEVYHREMWQHDYVINTSPPDQTIETRDILPNEDAFERDVYALWLEKSTGARYVICRSTLRSDGLLSGLGFLLPRGHEPDPTDRHLFEQLYPHIFRSFEIASRLRRNDSLQQDTVAVLDALPYGVAILDGQNEIIWASQTAYAISRMDDGISFLHRQMRFRRASDAQKVDVAIAQVRRRQLLEPRATSIAIERPSGKRAYAVQIFALPADMRAVYGGRASIVVLVHDTAAVPQKASDLWQQLFGLTPAQAIMADHLNAGLTLDQAAELMGIARSTAASHLRALFQKTECSRQSDLVRLLASIPVVR